LWRITVSFDDPATERPLHIIQHITWNWVFVRCASIDVGCLSLCMPREMKYCIGDVYEYLGAIDFSSGECFLDDVWTFTDVLGKPPCSGFGAVRFTSVIRAFDFLDYLTAGGEYALPWDQSQQYRCGNAAVGVGPYLLDQWYFWDHPVAAGYAALTSVWWCCPGSSHVMIINSSGGSALTLPCTDERAPEPPRRPPLE
jgi:hypothetical protein